MARYMDADGNIFTEDELWDTFLSFCDDYSDEEFAEWLESEGIAEI